MQGKYNNWIIFFTAWVYRQSIRYRIRDLVTWPDSKSLKPGCTIVIGMCSRLPGVLIGNLRLLAKTKWHDLREVIIVVDAPEGAVSKYIEDTACSFFTSTRVLFFYYSAEQYKVVESLSLPYVYSWLSWSIGLGQCATRYALLHDYDALIMDEMLALRYNIFTESGAYVQGISWYQGNGIEAEDNLATTFEAFLDVQWLMRFKPIQMFNQVAYNDGRSKDYDTLLDIQHRHTPKNKRTIMPMADTSLVHPTQMIHQYTMLQRSPTRAQPCGSIPMIPFFEWLSGKTTSLHDATLRIRAGKGRLVEFFGDGRLINLNNLNVLSVDWTLKQMIRVCLAQSIKPFFDLYDYGESLYQLCEVPPEYVWKGDFTVEQRKWIEFASLKT